MYSMAVREFDFFIIAIVEAMWYIGLKEPETFYTSSHPTELLDHLETKSAGTHNIKIIKLLVKMMTYHEDLAGIPRYMKSINLRMLRGGQKVSMSST